MLLGLGPATHQNASGCLETQFINQTLLNSSNFCSVLEFHC
jgi:hypothetical protein